MKILWNYCEYNIFLSIKMLSNKQLVTGRCVKLLVIGKKEKKMIPMMAQMRTNTSLPNQLT